MTTEQILERFENVTQSGGMWMARCPAHEDRSASLQVSERDNGDTGIHCHAGCVPARIMEAVGLQLKDLFLKSREGSAPALDEIEDVYEYTDGSGSVIFEVVRFSGKQFRQRLKGSEEWGLQGLQNKPLYRLPNVLNALASGRRIWVVEGEKDVHAIEAAGGVATCSVGGAGKWNDAYGKVLQGAAAVRIVADKDEPGIAHAEMVAQSLPEGTKFEIVAAKYGKDAHDHLSQGGTLDDFVRRPRSYHGIALISADMITPEDVDWVPGWEGFIPYGGISHIAGMPGDGKSTLTMRIVAEATRRGHDALLITSEDSKGHVIVPRLMAAGADRTKVHFPDKYLTLPRDMDGIQEHVQEKGIRVVVIDPVDAHLDGDVDSHKNQSIRSALAPLAFMADIQSCAVILVGHPNKGSSRDPMMRVGGSIGIPGISRSAMIMGRHPEQENVRVLASYKGNWAERPKSRMFRSEVGAADANIGLLSIRLVDAGTTGIVAAQLLPGQTRGDH